MNTIGIFALILATNALALAQPNRLPDEPPPPPFPAAIDTGFTVRLTAGVGRLLHVDAIRDFAPDRMWQADLGMRNTQWIRTEDNEFIPGIRTSTLFYGQRDSYGDTGHITSSSTRFGVRSSSGFGWAGSAGMILPYSSGSIVWTQLEAPTSGLDSSDIRMLSDFTSAQRFGSAIEMGVEISADNGLALSVGLERHLMYPRHLVFKWFVANLIQSVLSEGAASALTRRSGSTVAGPIIAFIVSNGIRFGISELQRRNMYWPFSSAPPLVYDTVVMSASFTL